MLNKTSFFIMFWTIVLGPFEIFILQLPIEAVLLIRCFAIVTNLFWYNIWFERNFWGHTMLSRVSRMVSMKFFVNCTNFLLLYGISVLVIEYYTIPIHFTLLGFAKKVFYVTVFAVVLTAPYELLLKHLGFEKNQIDEVDLASDIGFLLSRHSFSMVGNPLSVFLTYRV